MSRPDKRSWHKVEPALAGDNIPVVTDRVAMPTPLRVRTTPDRRARTPWWKPSKASAPKARAIALKPGDERFLQAVQEAQHVEARPATHAAIWLMLATVVAAITWAATTKVEQITHADARVVPDGHEQVIASLEGGILRELLVREGAKVVVGQPLLRLDPTRFEAQQNEGKVRRLSLLGSIARLRAESDGRALAFPPEVLADPRVVHAETEAYAARRRLLNEAVSANQQSINMVAHELDMAQRMSAQGLMSDVEVMRLKRQINDMRQQSLERQNRFRQDASTELLKAQSDLTQLEQQQVERDDIVRRTLLTSPVDGLVKNIRINTVGGIVGPGAPVMEIVPKGTRLLMEAKVKPADIGFVRVGQVATTKLSAYDFNVYGGLTGKVEALSPDALGDPDRPGSDATWYRALISIDASGLMAKGEPLPVIPGMTAAVEINTGERTVLEFILRPLLKAREAFRER
jgi:adhesin transport system membrane fusion protein